MDQYYRDGVVVDYYAEGALYRCLRVSHDGLHVKQTCDPDPKDHGVAAPEHVSCKALAYSFIQELKAGHWLDWRTRYVQVTIQLQSANARMDAVLNLFLEFPGDGGVLTSYEIDLSPNTEDQFDDIGVWMRRVLFFIALQVFFETMEILRVGKEYLLDVWNWLDALNLATMIFSIYLLKTSILADVPSGFEASTVEMVTGYRSLSETGRDFQLAREILAINTMLQFLKLIKFLSKIFRDVGIVTKVLEEAASNIGYYMITISLATIAAAIYMNMIVGDLLGDFYRVSRSIQTILRYLAVFLF
jgi:hypothetical protein